MKIKRFFASFLAVSILIGSTSGTVAMAENVDTDPAIITQQIDSSNPIENTSIPNPIEQDDPQIEDHLSAPSPINIEPQPSENADQQGEENPDLLLQQNLECNCTNQCCEQSINPDCPLCNTDTSQCLAVQTNEIVISAFEQLPQDIAKQQVSTTSQKEQLIFPTVLNAFDLNQNKIVIEGISWKEEKLDYKANDQEQYLFTAKLPEHYVLSEGVIMPTIMATIQNAEGTPILFENGIHYIIDPEYPDHKIVLFCMNNELHWPHHTDTMKDTQVPSYTQGYLTPSDFNSQADYDACMHRLSKLLYGGYPYNGERLYQIVEDSSAYTPTVEDFDDMLIVPASLTTAFPYLAHHRFSYADWQNQDQEHLGYLQQFAQDVAKLYGNHGTTANGLSYSTISSMPFYKAVFCILNSNDETPLVAFKYFYGADYFVTEQEAYNATQEAIWHLLYSYGIPDNNLATMSLPLSNVLYEYSEKSGLLDYQPSLGDIHLTGDLSFTYNPKDGMWHSHSLRIQEPSEYHGLYRLQLPAGMSALCDHLNYVYGDEEYELVSDHAPTKDETFGIKAELVWLEEFKQYSPSPDIEFEGKRFQHMIGAVIHNETLAANIPVSSRNTGGLSITQNLIGENDPNHEFQFELKLPYHQTLNGLYGDLEFHNGIAYFTLKPGETKQALNLPSNAEYVITELNTQGYHVGSTSSHDEILVDGIQNVIFTTTKLPDLSVSEIVSGANGDKTKLFDLTIELFDQNGNPINGEFAYVGSVYAGHEHEATAPESGTLHFVDGKAQIQLSHGQQITITDLPYQSRYTVTEINQNDYETIYNNGQKPDHDLLNEDKLVLIENHKNPTPTLPIDPEQPTDPDKPTGPEQPTKPEKPVDPNKPTDQNKPTNPDQPVAPNKPTNQNTPSDSNKPASSNQSKPSQQSTSKPKKSESVDTGRRTNLFISSLLLLSSGICLLMISLRKFNKEIR